MKNNMILYYSFFIIIVYALTVSLLQGLALMGLFIIFILATAFFLGAVALFTE